MARASEADIEMAMTLTGYMEDIERGYMPSNLVEDGESYELIDTSDENQYHRLITGLLNLFEHGSIGRVVWGMATVCDPANKLLDPESDVLEIHPDLASAADYRDELLAALEAIAAYPQTRASEVGATGLRDIARHAIAKLNAAVTDSAVAGAQKVASHD